MIKYIFAKYGKQIFWCVFMWGSISVGMGFASAGLEWATNGGFPFFYHTSVVAIFLGGSGFAGGLACIALYELTEG